MEKKLKLVTILYFLLLIVLISSCTVVEPYILEFYDYVGLGPDCAAEEILEGIIKAETSMSLDLTPSTPEQ